MCSHLCQILPELDLQVWGGMFDTNVEMWGPYPLLLSFVTFRCLEMLFCECPCVYVVAF